MASKSNRLSLASLENKLHYVFNNKTLLEQALTHRSYSGKHNERLEFLGDALLETIISNFLYKQFPHLPEGDLTRLRSTIVKGTSLAELAKSFNLGEYILLGDGELKSGGKRRDSILADVFEAIIAAIYLDSDFNKCESITLALLNNKINHLPDPHSLKDPKTQLQELLQGKGLPLPTYELINTSGPEHNRAFTIRVSSQNNQFTATESSRKKAEQAAAEFLLIFYQDNKL